MGLRRRTAAVAVAFIVLGACANGETPDVGAPTPTEGETDASPMAETTVQAVDSDHGTILANAEGETLYVFLNDEGGESTCYDMCAQTWPPLVVDGDPTADAEVTGALATTERRDGSQQVTIDGSPLYTYSADEEPGDTNGQGVGGVWFTVAPDGSPVRD